MKKILLIVSLFLTGCCVAPAQTDDYQQFRQQMLSNYEGYRENILQDYAKFLDTAWKRYETFKGKSMYSQPKPNNIPQAPVVDKTPVKVIPQPNTPQPAPSPVQPVQIKPEVPNPLLQSISFQFYTTTAQGPKIEVQQLTSANEHAVSKLWKSYQEERIYEKVSASLNQLRVAYNLNDWLTYILIRDYSLAVCDNDLNSSMVLSHYLLVNMGYNVRLALNGNGSVMHLMPVEQTVYEHPYLTIDGIRYYVFMGTSLRKNATSVTSILTCELPQKADLGKEFNLVAQAPQIPSKNNKSFVVTDRSITISGNVPESAISIAKDFVQTEVPVYATSSLSKDFENSILRQVSPQIQGLSEIKAVEKLLHFVQYAFNYKTDGDHFGYEKPYFVEENFYYPANDCEDRAVLFAFLVKNLLHLNVHLLAYPNHEATAVRFTDQSIKGDGYIYHDGSKYLICDPTYLGADVGQCMPQYENVKPQVELW